MLKKFMPLISVILIAAFVLSACAPAATPTPENVKITLWTKEGEVDGGLQYVTALTDAYTAAHPNVTFEVVNKDVETLREDFQTASLAGSAPDLLWTVSDHAGPFVVADLIQPVDGLVDLTKYVPSVVMNSKTWAVPISSGNHLMLLWNKDIIQNPPKDTDELLALAGTFGADIYPLVFNQTEPFWLAPFLGGFGGSVFAADGLTPTLNTPEMVNTLAFMLDLKTKGIIPAEGDYNTSDTLFKEGKAAMIINGDWSLGGYQEALGDKLGVGLIPMIKSTGKYPAPMTSGVYFMIPKSLTGAKLEAVKGFMVFATDEANQLDMVDKLKRLPALKVALSNEKITSDPILAASASQMSYGTPMPTVVEMRCNWDSIKPELIAVLGGTETPAEAAAKMQTSAEACIKAMQ
jgi:arabinogalactan oligomer/maltooligosaccharide transport system substrate-binding protein